MSLPTTGVTHQKNNCRIIVPSSAPVPPFPFPPASLATLPLTVGNYRINGAGRNALAFPPEFPAAHKQAHCQSTFDDWCILAVSPNGGGTGLRTGLGSLDAQPKGESGALFLPRLL